jgi:hypothetical protein
VVGFVVVTRSSSASCQWMSAWKRMIEKIVGEQFIEHLEIPAALHLLGVPPNYCLRGFTRHRGEFFGPIRELKGIVLVLCRACVQPRLIRYERT